jgi:hypothetical protein
MAAYLYAWNDGDECSTPTTGPLFVGGVVEASDADSQRAYLGAYLDSTRADLAQRTHWACPSIHAA